MKNLFYFFICAIMLTGCGDDEPASEPPPPIKLVEVEFKDATITRAKDGEWQSGDKIGVYMVAAGSKQINTSTILNAADNISFMVSSDGLNGQFKPSYATQKIIYPLKNAVDFYAYYPYATTSSQIVEVNTSNQQNLTKIDLMTATAKSKTQQNSVVKLDFKHRLAKITINLSGNGPGTTVTGVGAGLMGLSAKAKYDLVNNTFVEFAKNEPMTLPSTSDVTKFEAIVIPQATNGDTKIMMVANAIISECDINYIQKFEAGKDYQFEIVYVDEQFSIESLKIVDWFANDPLIKTYKLGDYYPDPDVKFNADKTVKSGTAPIGMVFWLDINHSSYKITDGVVSGQKGLIVDMIESPEPLIWSDIKEFTKAKHGILGVKNTLLVANYESYNPERFPAVAWAMERRKQNKILGMEWCLPADMQLRILAAGVHGLNWQMDKTADKGEIIDWGTYMAIPNVASYLPAQEKFIGKLVDAGGDEIFNKMYWSSTEGNSSKVLCWQCNPTTGEDYLGVKDRLYNVRCIAAF